MSEVRTCKCDICGEVFHVVPNEHTKCHISREYEENGEKVVKLYTDICPRCRNSISELLKDPDIIRKEYRSRSKLEDCMSEIYHRIDEGLISFWFGVHDPSYYEDIKRRIIEGYDEVHKSRDKWRHWCKVMIVAYIVMCVMSGITIGLLV